MSEPHSDARVFFGATGDDQPTKVLKAGETFYEATGCLHRVSKNPAAKGKARVIAVILHPREAMLPVLPEPKKE